MSGALPGVSGVLAAGPTTQTTVDALRETLAGLRAARTPKAAEAPAPEGPSLKNLVPAKPGATATADFVRELGRRAMGPPKAPAPSPDSIPPEILPLLFDRNAFAPGRAPAIADETAPPALPTAAPPAARPAPAAAPGPMDLTRFRAEPPRPEAARAPVPQPATTGATGAAEGPPRPVDVDLDRLARAPSNFIPLDVLQELKARHKGGLPIRPEPAPVNAAPVGGARGR